MCAHPNFAARGDEVRARSTPGPAAGPTAITGHAFGAPRSSGRQVLLDRRQHLGADWILPQRATQAKAIAKRRGGFLLTHVAFCGRCAKPLYGFRTKGGWQYYRCVAQSSPTGHAAPA
jgi:hypothetical protein